VQKVNANAAKLASIKREGAGALAKFIFDDVMELMQGPEGIQAEPSGSARIRGSAQKVLEEIELLIHKRCEISGIAINH
jgi:hypothetical protein